MSDREEKQKEHTSQVPYSIKEEPGEIDLTDCDISYTKEELFSPDQSHIQKRKRRLEQKTVWDEEEYNLFGRQIALKLQKLPTAHSKIMVQHIINTVLFEAELGKYNYPKDGVQGDRSSQSYHIPKPEIPSPPFHSDQQHSPESHSLTSESTSLNNFARHLTSSFADEDQSYDDL